MNAGLVIILLPILLSSCCMIRMVNDSTCAIHRNRMAVEMSTAAICSNIEAIEASNRAIEENRTKLDAINKSLKDVHVD